VLAAAVGMFLATIWAARIGQNAAAGISGIVGGFLLSYALLTDRVDLHALAVEVAPHDRRLRIPALRDRGDPFPRWRSAWRTARSCRTPAALRPPAHR
jgi:hypothetical protein